MKTGEDYVFIPLLFTEITPLLLAEAATAYLKDSALVPDGPLNALFIGSSSAKIRFSNSDWDAIIGFVNDSWKRDGRQWVITTSYRTGADLEERFKKGLEPDAIFDSVWYSSAPRKVTKAYLGLASRIHVTMDSLTMLTEAVVSEKPTYALCPKDDHSDKSNTHLRYVRDLSEKGFVGTITPDSTVAASEPDFETAGKIDYSESIRELLERIGWEK